MASPAAEHGRQVRQRLLEAAVELIPERGWAAVSTRVLADRAGVNPSVVHYHFPSLSVLLRTAVTAFARRMLEELAESVESARTPDEAVDTMCAAVQRYTGFDRESLLLVETYLASTRDESLRCEFGQLVTGFRERVGQWLRGHGIAAPEETAAVLLASFDGLLLQRGLGSVPDPGSVSVVLRGMLSQNSTTRE
ncbi:TetR/AcrR family transcriptional regulator [Actinopolyspora mortivallis]|uniref:TetR family transcriptional regulator n=1 Tax=Actinopolyspora mortivallis TaxID=33906 RepID=A0A2T0GWM9_ACTMO|nr:TetR/AcrR family transcriptional regulator [Actinopolyspora mortivallis]PRW63525.1 TetR family transcriptional regulator [Actinopolyspora mortivallis]